MSMTSLAPLTAASLAGGIVCGSIQFGLGRLVVADDAKSETLGIELAAASAGL